MTFVKLDQGLLSSSLWVGGDAETVRLWVYLLLAADAQGVVGETLPAIAHACHMPVERAEEILEGLTRPDRYSRTPTADGRRVVVAREPEWSIQIINFQKYRRKDHTAADRQRRHREQAKASRRDVTGKTVTTRYVTQAEAEEEAENGRTDLRPSAGGPASPAAEVVPTTPRAKGATTEAKPSWSREACDDWIARFGGTAPGGEIGRALKPLVVKNGWPEVREAWRSYLEQAEAQYVSAARFAGTYGRWSGSIPPPKVPQRADPVGARIVAAAARAIEEHGRGGGR